MKHLAFLILIFLAVNTTAFAKIITLPNVDLASLAGTWYRIAAKPIIVEPNCACARQVLSARADGKIDVLNTCNKDTVNGKLVTIKGIATAIDETNSKLSVNFGLPWGGDFYIIALADDYQWAVVTDRFGYSLYIQAKTPTINQEQFKEALTAASAQVNTKSMKLEQQSGCTYPEIK
jgi:apolipoprotein D and lipocalin family protein